MLVTSKKWVQLTMEGGVGLKKEGESTEEKVKGCATAFLLCNTSSATMWRGTC